MRLPSTARAGIFSLGTGILVFASVYAWSVTRTLDPIDIPITLAPGHIHTGDFKINVEASFSVQIRFLEGANPACSETRELQTRRLTSLSTQAIPRPTANAPGEDDANVTRGIYLGTFFTEPGQYNLDLEVLSSTQNFDACRPRLQIEANPYDYNHLDDTLSFAGLFSVVCVLLGISLLFVFGTTYFRKEPLEELRLRIFKTDPPSPPVRLSPISHRRSFPLLPLLGVICVTSGVFLFLATLHWYRSRSFVVVDMPISLGPGHIRTGEFTTRVAGAYVIRIATGEQYYEDCPAYRVIKTRWSLRKANQVIDHREGPQNFWEPTGIAIGGSDLHAFHAEQGTYNLDVEQLTDGSCLDFTKPRLRVELSGYDRAEYDDLNAELQLLSLFSFGLGLIFLFAYRSMRLGQTPRPLPLSPAIPELKPTWGITGLRQRRFLVKRNWGVNPVMNISTIALVCAFTWFTWLVPTWLMYASGERNSQGILASIPRKGVSAVQITTGLTAPLVTIDAKRHPFLNYKQTTWEDLPKGLEQSLRGLPVRVVYFDADRDALFMDAAKAIDIIQGLNAKPILLTPRSKSEQ